MNKGIAIGVIVAVIIIAGGIVLAQDGGEPETAINQTEIETGDTTSKSFEIGLTESVGMTEKP